MIPKARLDALTDGVFAFAMTLLVLNLQLPDDFHPANAAEMLDALSRLWLPALAYVISFVVLAGRWLSLVQARGASEEISATEARWWLAYLFFITVVPFSTMVIGRHVDFAPAVWLYAANMILPALVLLRIQSLPDAWTTSDPEYKVDLGLLIFSALVSVGISFVSPSHAMWAYILNAASPLLHRTLARQHRLKVD